MFATIFEMIMLFLEVTVQYPTLENTNAYTYEMRNDDPVISSTAKSMSPKFNKYWESYSIILSSTFITNTRYKLLLVEFAFNNLDPNTILKKIKDLRDQMHNLFEDYLPLPSRQSASFVGADMICLTVTCI